MLRDVDKEMSEMGGKEGQEIERERAEPSAATLGPLTLDPLSDVESDMVYTLLSAGLQCLKEYPLHDLDRTLIERAEAMRGESTLWNLRDARLSYVEESASIAHKSDLKARGVAHAAELVALSNHHREMKCDLLALDSEYKVKNVKLIKLGAELKEANASVEQLSKAVDDIIDCMDLVSKSLEMALMKIHEALNNFKP
ncbi:hypothetical protein AMTR_s00014p00105000 [Amborella trichopoda]|uniref:Uncharacterized protein n=1 Tax=Amborella trichopoda TaxID=13333 RepID=W1PGH7_AMBTC|nr:hypothetical protein AMTR_s00014p00105000 [Amborella trichopoda]